MGLCPKKVPFEISPRVSRRNNSSFKCVNTMFRELSKNHSIIFFFAGVSFKDVNYKNVRGEGISISNKMGFFKEF